MAVALQLTTLGLMTSRTFWSAKVRPFWATQRTMSRSVKMPTGRPASRTTMQLMPASRMRFTASAMRAVGSIPTTCLDWISRTSLSIIGKAPPPRPPLSGAGHVSVAPQLMQEQG